MNCEKNYLKYNLIFFITPVDSCSVYLYVKEMRIIVEAIGDQDFLVFGSEKKK